MVKQAKTPYPKSAVKIAPPTDGETVDRAIARTLMRPSVQAALTIRTFAKSDHDLTGFIDELAAQVNAVNGGDLKRAEGMLITQAHTLNELFNNLARRAHGQQHMRHLEAFFRLALKAQGQCRATLETLAGIKNPPVIYARQANVTTGPQQVNIGMAAPSHGREIEIEQSKLSGGRNELLSDTGASTLASRVDPNMETLGEIDRAEIRRG